MTDRIMRMLERATTTPIGLGVEKLRIAVDTLDKARNRTNFAYRAQLQADYYNRMPINIPEDDLIAGTGSSIYNGAELEFEMGTWTKTELNSLLEETGDMYYISPENYDELWTLTEKLKTANINNRGSDYSAELTWDNERLRSFIRSGVTMPVWKDRNSGSTNAVGQTGISIGPGLILRTVLYERIINEGARTIINEAKECIANEHCITVAAYKKHEYWTGIIKVFEGFINYANRHADLAEQMAVECDDPVRKAELLKMAEVCRRVPEYPARTFYEAVQAFWFVFLSQASNTMSAGRIDQYLYPFYKADKEAGILTDEQALELIENIRVKTTTMHHVRGNLARNRNSGDARWLNFIIGGCDEKGNDASNELTLLFIRSAIELQVPHHTITLRVGDYTPIEVIKKGVECVATGIGMPAFVSDKSYINFWTNKGFAIEDARNYTICGCLDAVIPGKARTVGVIFFNGPQVLDIFLHNGFCKFSGEQIGIKTGDPCSFETFDQFKEAYYKQQAHFIPLAAERVSIESLVKTLVVSDPFTSALMYDGVKCGTPIQMRHFEPFDTGITIMTVGGINVANSLTAIRKLIYDEKKYTMRQLIDALDANWEGYEEMRRDFIKAPKYGNGDEYADEQVIEFYAKHAAQVSACPGTFGSNCVPSGISISAHQPCGKVVGATPDGRKAYEILADGMISPVQGTDFNGPLAVFNSARKISQDEYSATLFNMKFSPSALKTDSDKEKLAMVLKTYLTNGGKQIQMNVVDRSTLLAAQKDPKAFRDVIVRVAGYSAYFVQLTNMLQNEIIDRTENQQI